MKVASLLLPVLVAALPAQHRAREPKVVVAGDWRVEIHYTKTSRPGAHAPRFGQEVLRFAPGAEQGRRIHQEDSTGAAAVFLRDDGLCFVDPVGGPPFLSFADGERLAYPLQPRTPCGTEDYDDLNTNRGGRVHFLGDQCVVVRRVRRLLQVASFEVDVERHTATPLQEILEICDDDLARAATAEAAMPDRLMLRLGDLLLWVNTGARQRYLVPDIDERWRARRLLVYSLERRTFVDLASIEYPAFDLHKERIVTFLERQSHNVVPEFETWAVERLGTWGFRNYTERLLQLLAATEGVLVHQPDGSTVWDLRQRRAVYLEALTRLNGR
jgi:hypothetical protein